MRRDVFHAFGGFDKTFGRPCIEDVELGMRLRAAGHRILLDNLLQVEHLKRWRLGNLIKTDIFDRGVPWTRVLLAFSREGGAKLDDLNVGRSQKVAALAAAGVVATLLVGGVWRPGLWAVPVLAVLGVLAVDTLTARGARWRWLSPVIVITAALCVGVCAWYAPIWIALAAGLGTLVVGINRSFYATLARHQNLGFAIAGFVPHIIYYLCALAGYALGVASHVVRPRTSKQSVEQDSDKYAMPIS